MQNTWSRSRLRLYKSVVKLSVGAVILATAGILQVIPSHAAVVTQTSTSLITTASGVVAISQPIAAFGLNISADAGETLDSVTVTINDTGTSNVGITDFASLGTSASSGFSLYIDDSAIGTNGVWDNADDLAATTAVTQSGSRITIDVNALALPANDTTTNSGVDYFIIFRSSPTIAHGDDFTLSIAAASDVVYSTGASSGMTTATTATITGDTTAPTVSARLTADRDNDGQIDAVNIQFTESLADDFGGSLAIDVAGFNGEAYVTGGVANDAFIRVTFTESGSVDTSATPTVRITNAGLLRDTALGGQAVDASGGNRSAGNALVAEGSATTSTDGAGPILTAAVVGRNAIGPITFNTIALTYSEAMQVSSDGATFVSSGFADSSVTLGSMATAKSLEGLATFNGSSDVAVASAGGSRLDVSTSTVTIYFNALSGTSYFGTATTAPSTDTYTAVSSVTSAKDIAGNAVNALAPTRVATVSSAWDITRPTVSAVYSCDADNDGDIEKFQANFSESILDVMLDSTFAQFEGDNDTTNGNANEEAVSAYATATGNCDGLGDDTDANDDKAALTLASGITGTDTAYLNLTAAAVRDWAGNRALAADNAGTETDRAAPVLISSSPDDNATGVNRAADIVLVFSEAMNTTGGQLTYSDTRTTGTYTETWSTDATYGADAKVTIAQSGNLLSGSHVFTVATAPAAAGAVTTFFGAAVGGGTTNPFNFSITASSDSATPEVTTYDVEVTAPNGGESLAGGSTTEITWSATSNTTSLTAVSLAYSTDGETYTTIATNIDNDGAYTWSVPNTSAETVWVKVTGTDLVVELASDMSNASFRITADDEVIEAPESDETGISPVTGAEENLSVVNYGDYIKSPSFSSVYFVDYAANGQTLIRRPFMDQQTFMTWEDDFSNVLTVTDATLPTLSMGAPILPKAGVVLVKIQSVPKVYAIEADNTLRWITSEAVAIDLFGSAWADYVIDIPDTLYPRFEKGTELDSDDRVNTDMLKTRAALNQ